MRVVQINSFGNLSTGSVMRQCHAYYLQQGYESWMVWARGVAAKDSHEQVCSSKLEILLDGAQTRLFGKAGFHSKHATKRLLSFLDEINPDVVHLHNLHGYYLSVELLFNWLLSRACKVVWTLHDCWAFTGHCGYFTYVKCPQWKTHCGYEKPCPQINTYPKTISKKSPKWSFEHKKKLFTSLPSDRLVIITPSHWLESLVKESFLSKYPVQVVHNTVDTNIFKPTPSDFRNRYGIGDKFMILGVASTWSERKGLSDFVCLSEELNNEDYAIVLVGLNKKQLKEIPEQIIGISRTDSPVQLAEIYTAADVFFNPTKEENYPTVNLEAEACGTPVWTYNTGGCRETIGKNPFSKLIAQQSYEVVVKLLQDFN